MGELCVRLGLRCSWVPLAVVRNATGTRPQLAEQAAAWEPRVASRVQWLAALVRTPRVRVREGRRRAVLRRADETHPRLLIHPRAATPRSPRPHRETRP